MKYMGSKRALLANGLGDAIAREVRGGGRFHDLFAGSGAVARHVACTYAMKVVATDLQLYSAYLSGAVLNRTSKFNCTRAWSAWLDRATRRLPKHPTYSSLTAKDVYRLRRWCGNQTDRDIVRAYGGYYYSPRQAVWLDALRRSAPRTSPNREVAIAALLEAASRCAASPGHTAQPFRPTQRAIRHIEEAWRRDLPALARDAFFAFADQHALRKGRAYVGDANEVARGLRAGDVAFVDPPYSGVHYSRFYHVLETVAHGACGEVTGAGRYPSAKLRPRSSYSIKSTSHEALSALFQAISSAGAKAIVTFPEHQCSNGLSGGDVLELAERHFRLKKSAIASRLSTLGGGSGRAARLDARELVLTLTPR